MIDIHTHILSVVDDGSKDDETSISMLKMAETCGVTDIIATPHVIERHNALPWSTILSKTQALQDCAHSKGLDINIHFGAELEMNWELIDLLQGTEYCLAGSKYILVELPASMVPNYADDFWFEVRLLGLIPILAHPERNRSLMQNTSLIDKWKKEGLLMQCNAGSLTGLYGTTARKSMDYLIDRDYVDFIASDAHDILRRNTDLSECRNLLIDRFGEEYADRVLKKAQQNILAAKYV